MNAGSNSPVVHMVKTSSARIKALPEAGGRTGFFLLSSGIVTAFVAVSLLIAWFTFPTLFLDYVMPIVTIFLPVTFYSVFALSLYYKKFRVVKPKV